ncbi:MAG: GcrA family cell cycle regulator [Alphaproteobacteria bacterium]
MALEWTEERIAELTKLWSQELSTAEIGRMLGITKNAVVGKAHRLGLPKRQSPIKKIAKKPKPKLDLIRLENLEHGMCCWPSGDPNDDDFHFCGKPSIPSKPYCLDHCKQAYVKAGKD